jgi:GNAT superfamily N-acetyltransferase
VSGFVIEEVLAPESVDAPDAADFVRAVEVGNLVEVETYGTPEITYEPAEELPSYHNAYEPHRLYVARVEGVIVGRATAETHAGDDADTAWVSAQVLAEFRGRGIGRALTEATEMAFPGIRKTIAYVAGTDLGGARLTSPTGFGTIAADARETRFLLAAGYRFEQVERLSRLALPLDRLDARVAAAQEASGLDYRVHTWVGRTPERWLEDRALLATRMSTDAPSAGLEEPENVWTVDRVRDSDERLATNPRSRVVAAAEHVPSGHLVGYTMLSVPRQSHRAVDQWATLVLREHRGHRLGMLLKVANLAHLAAASPGHPSVLTFNAEENRPMLAVNEQLGFAGIGYEGAWRKDLT